MLRTYEPITRDLVSAIQVTAENIEDLAAYLHGQVDGRILTIPTLEGNMTFLTGEYLVKDGSKFFGMMPEKFEEKYTGGY